MIIPLSVQLQVVAPAVPKYPYGNCLYINDEIPALLDLGAGGDAFADIPKESIQMALISHFHFDHLHCDSLFPQAALLAGEEEKLAYSDPSVYIRIHGYDLWDDVMPGVERKMYGQVVALPPDVPIQPGFRDISLAGTFTDGQEISFGRTKARAVHLPGHTIGHYGFWFESENILFSGDVDMVHTGPWYNSASADVEDLIQSVRRIKEINPRIIVPSHRRIQDEGISEKLDRYIQVVLNREDRIFEALSHPLTLDELADHHFMFPEGRNMYELFWEKMTIRHHLRHLAQRGLIREELGTYYRT